MSQKTATCERTGKKTLLADGFFVVDTHTADWSFICVTAPKRAGDYSIPVEDLVESPEELVDWIANLNEKIWFDAKKFADFFTRFRKSNNLFGLS